MMLDARCNTLCGVVVSADALRYNERCAMQDARCDADAILRYAVSAADALL